MNGIYKKDRWNTAGESCLLTGTIMLIQINFQLIPETGFNNDTIEDLGRLFLRGTRKSWCACGANLLMSFDISKGLPLFFI